MNAEFDDKLSLKKLTVTVGGRCVDWNYGDRSAVIENVRVTRGDFVASSAASVTVQKGALSWSLDVRSSGKLTLGPAQASASVTVTTADGTHYRRRLQVGVRLSPGPDFEVVGEGGTVVLDAPEERPEERVVSVWLADSDGILLTVGATYHMGVRIGSAHPDALASSTLPDLRQR